MKGRKWGKLPSVASCFRTSSDCFARVQARVQKLRVYRYLRRGNDTPLSLTTSALHLHPSILTVLRS